MFFHVLFVWLLASKLALSWPVSHISSVHPTLNLKFKDVFLVIGGICAARSDLGRFCNQGFGKYNTNMHQQDRRALKNGFWMVLACSEWFLHISANLPAIDFTQGSECGQPGPLLCPQELSNCWDALDRNLIDQDSFCQATRRLIEQTRLVHIGFGHCQIMQRDTENWMKWIMALEADSNHAIGIWFILMLSAEFLQRYGMSPPLAGCTKIPFLWGRRLYKDGVPSSVRSEIHRLLCAASWSSCSSMEALPALQFCYWKQQTSQVSWGHPPKVDSKCHAKADMQTGLSHFVPVCLSK